MRIFLPLYLIVSCVTFCKVKGVGTSCDPADSDEECGKVVIKNEKQMWKHVCSWIICWTEQVLCELATNDVQSLQKAKDNLRQIASEVQEQLGITEERDPTEYGNRYRKKKEHIEDKHAKVMNKAIEIVKSTESILESITGKENTECDEPEEVSLHLKQLDKDEAKELAKKYKRKQKQKLKKQRKKEKDGWLLEKIAEKTVTKKPAVTKRKRRVVVRTEKPKYDQESLVKELVECAERKAKEHKSERAKCIKKCQKRRKLCHDGCKRVAKETVKQYVNCLNKSGKTKPHEETTEKNKKQNHKTKSKNKSGKTKKTNKRKNKNKKLQKKKTSLKKKKKSMKKKRKPNKKNRKKKLRQT